jgi:hypothetical protein
MMDERDRFIHVIALCIDKIGGEVIVPEEYFQCAPKTSVQEYFDPKLKRYHYTFQREKEVNNG